MQGKKYGTIAFVIDERLSREKSSMLARVVASARGYADVKTLSGDTTEESLVKQLETMSANLVLVPWYRYLAWSRVEALYGLTRTSGPTFAGYFCEQLLPYELGGQADHLRAILIDFTNPEGSEIHTTLRSLVSPPRRSGIRPLLETASPVYCENWYQGQGLGARMDAVLALPEIANTDWSKRANSIRLCLNAFWSLIYEEGPGKGEITQALGSKSPRAYFQIGVNARCVAMRLCYSMPQWSPKDTLGQFWPEPKRPTSAAQLLLRYADFLRVHTVAENQDIEVVATLFPSAAAERGFGQVHTLWVEPITAQLITEAPFEAPGPAKKHLLPLPLTGGGGGPRLATDDAARAGIGHKAKDRFIVEAAVKIRELKNLLAERDDMINELRAGGVGTSQPMPPPDAESLLEAFQERYFEARFQIRQFEISIAQLERGGATPEQIEALRVRMNALANREQAWIKRIAATLEHFRESKTRASGD